MGNLAGGRRAPAAATTGMVLGMAASVCTPSSSNSITIAPAKGCESAPSIAAATARGSSDSTTAIMTT